MAPIARSSNESIIDNSENDRERNKRKSAMIMKKRSATLKKLSTQEVEEKRLDVDKDLIGELILDE